MAPPVKNKTKYGHQPIREVVWRHGLSHTQFSEMIGVRPINHVRFAMYGLCPPSAELRRAAVAFLNVPIEQLFTPESLAAIHRPGKRKRPSAIVQNAESPSR